MFTTKGFREAHEVVTDPCTAIVVSRKESCVTLVTQLESMGFEVTRTHSFLEAEHALKASTFDLVAMDLFLDEGPTFGNLMIVASSPHPSPRGADVHAFLHTVTSCSTGLVFDLTDPDQSRAAIELALHPARNGQRSNPEPTGTSLVKTVGTRGGRDPRGHP